MALFTPTSYIGEAGPILGGMVWGIDFQQAACYPGSGTSVFRIFPSSASGTGTLTNGPTFSSENYGILNIVDANPNRYIVFPSTGLPAGNAARTMGIWVRNNLDSAVPIFYGTDSTNAGIGIQQISSGATFRFFGYANDFDVAVPNMFNRWVYMLGTFDGTNAEIWLNGVSYGRSNRSGWNTSLGTNTLNIGRAPWTTADSVNGSVAVAHIYNRVLTRDEILQNFNFYKPRYI
jgi:hypothetical protein